MNTKFYLWGSVVVLSLTLMASSVVAEAVRPANLSDVQALSKTKSTIAAPHGFVVDGIPAVLSENDVKTYKWMFDKQRRLQRKKVASRIKNLDDKKILMGNLVAERLLHPYKRATYADLKSWLSKYNDHAQAKSIYSVAKKRKPKNGGYLPQPRNKKLSLARYGNPDDLLKTSNEKVKKTKKRRNLLSRLKRYRVKGQFEKALATLAKSSTRKTLGSETWYQVSLKLSRSLLNSGFYEEAERLSSKVAAESPNHRPNALWISGFSAYRQGKSDEAVKDLRRLVYTVPNNSSHYARAAFWTARIYDEQKRPSMANVFMNMAAQDKLSFYGQMAIEKLQKASPYAWKAPKLNDKHMKRLMAEPAIKRVIALVQINEHALAQRELKAAYANIPYDMDETLLAFSTELNLPGASMTLARNLLERDKDYLEGLYPYSDVWTPYGGYKVSRALMNAIARQESAFDPLIESRAGARGLMQVMPSTAKYIRAKQGKRPYSKASLNNPKLSLKLGQQYLGMLDERLNGNLIYMIAGYNAGPGNVEKWLKKDASIAADPALFIESIPFTETRKYVTKVMSNFWMYQHRFQEETPTLTAMAQNQWPGRVRLAQSRY